MNNLLREQILQAFIDLYAPDDSDLMIKRMPTESEDEDGTKFEEYFDMLQTIASVPKDRTLSGETLEQIEAQMRLVALKYGFPKQIILKVKNDETANSS